MIRDDEIQRLIKYAQGMGVRVLMSKAQNSEDSAEFSLDGTEITVYVKSQNSKTETILSLIHELGHLLDHIHQHDRQLDVKFEQALDPNRHGKISKKKRKVILDSEVAATAYWHTIYKETDLKFPMWKLEAQMQHDIWQYEFYYENGRFPNSKERHGMKIEIYNKHKVKNEQ